MLRLHHALRDDQVGREVEGHLKDAQGHQKQIHNLLPITVQSKATYLLCSHANI